MAELLQLAPPEERLLRQVMAPDTPGRLRSFFERPVQRPGDVILAVLLAGVGLALLFLIVGLVMELLGDDLFSELLQLLAIATAIVTFAARDTRLAVQERLIRRLYGALEQRNSLPAEGWATRRDQVDSPKVLTPDEQHHS